MLHESLDKQFSWNIMLRYTMKLRSVMKRLTDSTTSGQTDTTSGQTSTASGHTKGQTSSKSGKTSTTSG